MQLANQKTSRFILAIGLQTIIIVALFLVKYSTVVGGVEVLLRIAPIDPRDPLRGDYVTFQLQDLSRISTINFKEIPTNGQIVYVPLRKSNDYWVAGRNISAKKPVDDSVTFIKGRVVRGGDRTNTIDELDIGLSRSNLGQIQISYGVEDFFIPEGSGWNLPRGDATALVAVDSNGGAVLKQVYIGSKKWP